MSDFTAKYRTSGTLYFYFLQEKNPLVAKPLRKQPTGPINASSTHMRDWGATLVELNYYSLMKSLNLGSGLFNRIPLVKNSKVAKPRFSFFTKKNEIKRECNFKLVFFLDLHVVGPLLQKHYIIVTEIPWLWKLDKQPYPSLQRSLILLLKLAATTYYSVIRSRWEFSAKQSKEKINLFNRN